MTVKLIFSRPPLTTLPVALVFGEDEDPNRPATVVTAEATLPAMSGVANFYLTRTVTAAAVFPAMTGTADLTYFTDTDRPLANAVKTKWQEGVFQESGVITRFQDGTQIKVGVTETFSDGVAVKASKTIPWQDGVRINRSIVAKWQEGLKTGRSSVFRWQEGVVVRRSAANRFQDGLRLGRAAGFKYQDGIPVRNWAAARFQEGALLSRGFISTAGYGVDAERHLLTKFQDAMRPPPGKWPGRPIPPVDLCYLPPAGDDVALIFVEPAPATTELVFVCERHPTGGPIVVPVKRAYLVINTAYLTRVSDGTMIPTLNMSMSLDVDSWTWSFSAGLPRAALSAIEPVDGAPVEVEAMVNGVPYRFLIESISSDRTFGQASLKVGGRGKTALLDTPYAMVQTFTNTEDRTAQQLMADVLTDNGVPLDWTVNWGITDWNVPAGVFSQTGSYMAALNAIAAAAGAYIQPDPSEQTINVFAKYPVAPWQWSGVTPDFVLPSSVTQRETIDWADKIQYNRIFVSGQQQGVLGDCTITDTAGDIIAPMVTDPLITEDPAARQRAIAELSSGGRVATVGIRLPVLELTGIIPPGKFIQYTDGGVSRFGISRGVSVDISMPTIWQTITVETHV